MNPVHVLAPFFFKFHLNITLPSAPGFSSCPFSFCHQNLIRIFILFPAHLNFPDSIIMIDEEHKLLNCHDVVFSSLLSILPTEAQISSSARYSLTSSDYVLNYFAFSLLYFFFKFGIFVIRNFCPCSTEQGREGCTISDLHSGDPSFESVRHQVLHQYKTTGKTAVLYILIYTFIVCKGVCAGDIFLSAYGAFLTSLNTPHQTTFFLFGRHKFGPLPFLFILNSEIRILSVR